MSLYISKGTQRQDDLDSTVEGSRSSNEVLRGVPDSASYFWDSSQTKHLRPSARDKVSRSGNRELPENELAVMALNEIAAQRGHGFFFHLPNRDCWKKPARQASLTVTLSDGELLPASRGPNSLLEPDFPNLCFMRFVWDETTRAAYLASSHRSRYLKSDGLLNPPADVTPLYCIQYAASSRYPLYVTSSHSLVVMATQDSLYLASTYELRTLVGTWSIDKRPPKCDRPDLRLNTTPYLWSKDGIKSEEAELRGTMNTQFRLSTVDELYEAILNRCNASTMAASMTALDLQRMIPRPTDPECGVPLGTPFGDTGCPDGEPTADSANPKSRRGGRLKRVRKDKAVGGSDRESTESTG